MRRDKPRLLVTGGAGYLGAVVVRAAGEWEVACTRTIMDVLAPR